MYGDRGLQILAFPCNQFGGQEPGTHTEILEFAKQFDADMPSKLTFFEKASVNGAETREVFSFLKNALPSDDGTNDIRWNFAKFLLTHKGEPYKRYGPKVPPMDLENDIKELLKVREQGAETSAK